MNLATATITVYFIGVIHFYNPEANAPRREVIVPQASAVGAKYGTQNLEPHEARVVIEGLAGGSEACTSLNGTYAPAAATCSVPVSGKIITLPASTKPLSFEKRFGDIPRVARLCPGVGALKAEYLNDPGTYAARLTLESGKLDTCRNGKAQIARLTITTKNPALTIGRAPEVQLNDDAVVKIVNAPLPASTKEHSHADDERSHFMWHYKMYDTPVFCTQLPDDAKELLSECPAGVAAIADLDVGTGSGCSPSGSK